VTPGNPQRAAHTMRPQASRHTAATIGDLPVTPVWLERPDPARDGLGARFGRGHSFVTGPWEVVDGW